MKKLMTLALASVIIFGMFTVIFTSAFTVHAEDDDIWSDASDWAVAELKKANDMAVIPDSLKNQDFTKPITRAEFAAVAVKVYENLSGKKISPASNNPFIDTKDPEVLKAYGVGITGGVSADKFEPDTPLSREQAATMLTRVLKAAYISGWTLAADESYELDFTMPQKFDDDDRISEWAKPSVYFMAANEIIRGTGNNMFSPHSITTAEQAIIIGMRLVDNLKDRNLSYSGGPKSDGNDLVGVWEYTNSAGTVTTYEYMADGRFRLGTSGGALEGTYKIDGNKLMITIPGVSADETNYKVNGNTLTIIYKDGTVVVFTRR